MQKKYRKYNLIFFFIYIFCSHICHAIKKENHSYIFLVLYGFLNIKIT